MEQLHLDLGEKAYDIIFEQDFARLPDCLVAIQAPQKLLLVTDSTVDGLYGRAVLKMLRQNGYDTAGFVFPAGEAQKQMQTVLDICEACIAHQMDRNSMIIALGGGVVGDMAGFAAAIYMRGIRYVQVPTTLLSQSDSSVGGKTAIDFADGKNILGAFHQPKLVYINVSTLKTLPNREFISGMGEVIKHGIIRNASFFAYLEQNHDAIAALEPKTLISMAKTNCGIKAEVVMQDEFENGLRSILNFGHTIGHAVESYKGYTLSHGECVGLGMLAASWIARGRGLLPNADFTRILAVLSMYGFPMKTALNDKNRVLDLMQKDKKKAEGKLKFILPASIGTVIQTRDVTTAEILGALEFISLGGTV